jgi:hypothetical protein
VKRSVLAFAVLAMCSLSFGRILPKPSANPQSNANPALLQQKIDVAKVQPRSILATDECSFTFNSGANSTSVEYCVTVNGNIPEFKSPKDFLLISSDRREGYGICDVTSGVEYFDWAEFGDSNNWNPSNVVSHTGTSVKIVRNTNDGIWTLTQTITQVPATSSAKIVMSLKNNTAVPRTALILRYADSDIDDNVSNNLDATSNDAFAWNSITGTNPGRALGLALQNVGNENVDRLGWAQDTPSAPDPCNPTTNFVPAPLINVDGSLVQAYEMVIPKWKSKTVTVSYKPL